MHPFTRLAAIAYLTPHDCRWLAEATEHIHKVKKGLEIPGCLQPAIIRSGWGGLVRFSPAGQHAILQVALPGDVLSPINRPDTRWIALTQMTSVAAPPAEPGSTLAAAYDKSAKIDVLNLEAQIFRCGFLSAEAKLAGLYVELHARLALADYVSGREFVLPLTQYETATMLGITAVHLNRTRKVIADIGLAELGLRHVRLGSALMERSEVLQAAYRLV